MKKLLALLFSLCLAAAAHAAADPDRYLLTVATLQKMEAVNKDLSKLKISKKSDEDDDDNQSVEEFAKKLDADPRVKAALAKNGMTSMDFSLATYAMFAAGMHLMFESSMDKKKGAALYASYPKERQANIELLRKNPQFMAKK
ncbi:hypothetical protein [Noviherbaspirillum autotrophicum]|uniref:Uncharacterized protein n=1 Tax=Noviherbaspirillum autotrophicum TaxID=709839 RepID=A0A0C1YS02_9BURK|nr:hypothetical protein [Noviherbaspirillum autotrophicum]KIF83487.1 hypothetical protein TSA66_04200 [Noviherbaspirillum autotrophicum]